MFSRRETRRLKWVGAFGFPQFPRRSETEEDILLISDSFEMSSQPAGQVDIQMSYLDAAKN